MNDEAEEIKEKKVWQTPEITSLNFNKTGGGNQADTGEDTGYISVL